MHQDNDTDDNNIHSNHGQDDDDGEFDDEGRLYAVIPINQSVREVSLFKL